MRHARQFAARLGLAAVFAAELIVASSSGSIAQTRALVPTIDPENQEFLRVRGPTGRPCLALKGMGRPNPIIPSQMDHIIAVENSCPKRIKVKACYYRTTRCTDFEVGSYDKMQVLLGTMSDMPSFRFAFTEKAAI